MIGHAVCDSPVGPCVKDIEPWLGDHESATAPGGPEVVSNWSGTGVVLVYHAWTDGAVGYEEGYRNLYVTVLRFDDGQPMTPPPRGLKRRWAGMGPGLHFPVRRSGMADQPRSSSGLGRHPLKVVARVQIPYGVQPTCWSALVAGSVIRQRRSNSSWWFNRVGRVG